MEENDGGDCFVTTYRVLERLGDCDGIRLVHAYVDGNGELQGVRFAHAWVELNEKAFDFSNGKTLVVDAKAYRRIGNVRAEPGQLSVFTLEEAYAKALAEEHYGPWDLAETGGKQDVEHIQKPEAAHGAFGRSNLAASRTRKGTNASG